MSNELIERIVRLENDFSSQIGINLKGRANSTAYLISMQETLQDCKSALAQQQEDYEELQSQYHFLASEMVYEGNSVQHWRQKALAYKECAGVIYELKSLLGVETPADVLEQVKTQQQEAEPVVGPFALAVIGRQHFGNPIPPEWYTAAKELLGLIQESAAQTECNCPGAGKSESNHHAPNCPVRKAAQPQVPEGYALTPIEPADGLLISMACRDRHDFGLLSRGMQESIMGSMRQVHQEVVGAGFYNPDKEAEYKSMLSAAQSVTMDDAIAAGDGTIHGAIDYWQERALKAEAAQPQVPDSAMTVGTRYQYTKIGSAEQKWWGCVLVGFDGGQPIIRTDAGHYHLRPLTEYRFRAISAAKEEGI